MISFNIFKMKIKDFSFTTHIVLSNLQLTFLDKIILKVTLSLGNDRKPVNKF